MSGFFNTVSCLFSLTQFSTNLVLHLTVINVKPQSLCLFKCPCQSRESHISAVCKRNTFQARPSVPAKQPLLIHVYSKRTLYHSVNSSNALFSPPWTKNVHSDSRIRGSFRYVVLPIHITLTPRHQFHAMARFLVLSSSSIFRAKRIDAVATTLFWSSKHVQDHLLGKTTDFEMRRVESRHIIQ